MEFDHKGSLVFRVKQGNTGKHDILEDLPGPKRLGE